MADEKTDEQLAQEAMASFVSEAHADGKQIDQDGKPIAVLDEGQSAESTTTDETAEKEAAGDENTDESADNAESTETPEEKTARETAEAAAKPKKQTAQERINELTREKHEERRLRAELEARLAALERGETPKKDALTPPAAASKDDGAPDPAKFEFGELDVKYIAAVAKHEVRQELKAEAAARAKEAEAEKAKATAEEFKGRVAKLKEAGATVANDFESVVFDDSVGFTPTIGELAFSSEHGAQVAYEIAKLPPKERDAIFGKPPLEQAAFFGRLEAKFSAASAAKTGVPKPKVTPTKAPIPPATQARGANGSFKPDINKTDDFRTFEKLARQME